MLNITRLLCGTPTPGDLLRYGEIAGRKEALPGSRAHNKPVVVCTDTRLTATQRPTSSFPSLCHRDIDFQILYGPGRYP